jgi:hypothetical protein
MFIFPSTAVDVQAQGSVRAAARACIVIPVGLRSETSGRGQNTSPDLTAVSIGDR